MSGQHLRGDAFIWFTDEFKMDVGVDDDNDEEYCIVHGYKASQRQLT